MTRFLSQALQAPEPFFRHGLQRMEAANGHPNNDIRFSTEVQQATRQKLHELGLDPADTTPQELYQALQVKIRADDAKLTRTLRTLAATHVSAVGDVTDGMVQALRSIPDAKRCYAMKPNSFKRIIKILPPKKAMKRLGYRSVASFLKHESPANILIAAWLSEDARWQKRLLEQYKRLKPSDFENRTIAISKVSFKHWPELAEEIVASRRHTVISFKELGVVAFLPLPARVPSGIVTASLALAIHELNEIRATSSYLKLSQVRADFGEVVKTVARNEASLHSQLLDRPVPWHIIQRYYARLKDHFREEVFEPHIRLEDMIWQPLERTLSAIEPSLAFWHGSGHLGLTHAWTPVSLNLLDAALNYCNGLPFERRIARHFRESLWHELLLRYLQPATVEQTVMHELQPDLANELARV